MSRAERFPPDDPREWLNRARSNLARAHARVPDAYLEDLCFDAQQAAEYTEAVATAETVVRWAEEVCDLQG